MAQKFIVVKCYSCSTFQVEQVKKSTNKWTCKICHEKQTLKQLFFCGSGRDCRTHVQQNNILRQQRTSKLEEHCEEYISGEPEELIPPDDNDRKVDVLKESKWHAFVSEGQNNEEAEVEEEEICFRGENAKSSSSKGRRYQKQQHRKPYSKKVESVGHHELSSHTEKRFFKNPSVSTTATGMEKLRGYKQENIVQSNASSLLGDFQHNNHHVQKSFFKHSSIVDAVEEEKHIQNSTLLLRDATMGTDKDVQQSSADIDSTNWLLMKTTSTTAAVNANKLLQCHPNNSSQPKSRLHSTKETFSSNKNSHRIKKTASTNSSTSSLVSPCKKDVKKSSKWSNFLTSTTTDHSTSDDKE